MNGYPLLPASPMLLDHLLGLVFILHILFMNFLVAAPFVIAWYLLVKGESGRQRARWMANVLPIAFTFAINFGVAALLFIQALFSERFFSSNALLGYVWLAVILLIMTAFYGTYLVKRSVERGKRRFRFGGLLSLIVGGLIWCVGLIMISNYFISTSRGEWFSLQGHPGGIVQSITFIPRALHFLVGSCAVTGFWMMWIAWWKDKRGVDHTDVRKLRQQGIALATAATAVQVVIGIWFVLWQPQETWDKLFAGSFVSIVWMSGVAAGLLMLASLVIANFLPRPKHWIKIATGLLLYTLMGMVSGREIVRITAFGPDFHVAQIPSSPQTAAIRWFGILLLAALLTIFYLLRLVWRASQVRSE